MLESIATMVRDLLTSQRSNIKQKVCCQLSGRECLLIDSELSNSMRSQSHVSVLARTLAPGAHFEITLNHWGRYAFLVCIAHRNRLDECLFLPFYAVPYFLPER